LKKVGETGNRSISFAVPEFQTKDAGCSTGIAALRPVDLAREAGISPQQVRNYETLRVLPAAARTDSGRRVYGACHLLALRTARALMAGYGWQPAVDIMRAVHAGDMAAVVALVDARHAQIDRRRREVEKAIAGLSSVRTEAQPLPRGRAGLHPAEAAALVGVRPSALRFWEQQGLLRPDRERYNAYRVYGEEQLRRLQIVVILRQLGYRAQDIRSVLDQVAAGQMGQALEALRKRQRALMDASWSCMEATVSLRAYLGARGLSGA
jgi:DNA-binding transcriptional MerR regulator